MFTQLRTNALLDQIDAQEEYDFALAYLSGDGVKKNLNQAIRLLHSAADKGSADAQFDLAVMYLEGEIIKRNAVEAARLLSLAATQGHDSAQYGLGRMYLKEVGVKRDTAEAARLFRLAAEQENEDAQNRLGCLYRDGVGVKRDTAEAARLFRLAAEQGNYHAKLNLKRLYDFKKDSFFVDGDCIIYHTAIVFQQENQVILNQFNELAQKKPKKLLSLLEANLDSYEGKVKPLLNDSKVESNLSRCMQESTIKKVALFIDATQLPKEIAGTISEYAYNTSSKNMPPVIQHNKTSLLKKFSTFSNEKAKSEINESKESRMQIKSKT